MKNYLIYIIGCLLAVINTGCIKYWKACDGENSLDLKFILPVSLTPVKDTFNIGDTITIEHIFNENLVNQVNGKMYSVANHDFKTRIVITDLNSVSSKTYKNPNLLTIVGESSGNFTSNADYQAIYVNYQHENAQYKYKVLFIVDKPGFYLMNFKSQNLENRANITDCPEEWLEAYYTLNNNGDNNYEMIKNAKDDFYNKYSIEQYNKEGCYCFYVR